jgi:hypothetical protein
LPIFGGPKLKIWGQKLKIFTPGSFAPNSKFLLQGLLPIFGGPKLKIWGPNLKIFTPGSFAPKLFLHLKSFLAGRRFHDNNEVKEAVTTCFALQAASFYDEGYKNWCNAMTNASTMVETMSKSSVRCVHQMAIYMVCYIYIYF